MRATLSLWMAVAACNPVPGPSDDVVDTDSDPVDTTPTYHRDALPILEARCGACHTAGGQAPFDVHYDPAAWASGPPSWTTAAIAAIDAGTMPPWAPADDCFPVQDSRRVPETELAVLHAWADAGFPEGDLADTPAPTNGLPDTLGVPDLELRSDVAYTPDPAQPDDYRCIVVDPSVADDAWVRAVTVAPDQRRILHHVILYGMDASWSDDVAAWDAAAPGVGYPCFGSPGTWEADTLAGWAPGQRPEVYGDDVARRLAKGTVLVLQVHYNTVGLMPDAIPADRTAVQMWTLPPGESPALEVRSVPLPDTDLDIPAGDPDVVEESTIGLDQLNGQRRTIGVFPHMHTLGTSIRLDAVHPDGSEQCIVNLPEWNFAWQQAYFFDPEQNLLLNRNDKLRLRCTYDNSAANQQTVNGVLQEPRQVGWGEGTYDEMCLIYMYVTLPVTP